MVLTAYSELSPVIGFLVTVAARKLPRDLNAGIEASGPHDFAVRKFNALVSSTACVHRIPPRVRDDRDTPLEWDETSRTCR